MQRGDYGISRLRRLLLMPQGCHGGEYFKERQFETPGMQCAARVGGRSIQEYLKSGRIGDALVELGIGAQNDAVALPLASGAFQDLLGSASIRRCRFVDAGQFDESLPLFCWFLCRFCRQVLQTDSLCRIVPA